jgi:hypothetical protein
LIRLTVRRNKARGGFYRCGDGLTGTEAVILEHLLNIGLL